MRLGNRIFRTLFAATLLVAIAAAVALSSRAAEPPYRVAPATSRAFVADVDDGPPAALAPLLPSPERRTQTAPQPLPPTGAAEAAPPALSQEPFPMPPELIGVDLSKQTEADAMAKSRGCIVCHENIKDMHAKATVRLGCVDCHGGNPNARHEKRAHVASAIPGSLAQHGQSGPLVHAAESRIAGVHSVREPRRLASGASSVAALCHAREVLAVRKSMMTHGCMLWGAALYNNGSIPSKLPRYGESYSMCGAPQRLQTVPPPTRTRSSIKGVVPYLDPLPRFEISSRATCCGSSSAAAASVPRPAFPSGSRKPGAPRTRLEQSRPGDRESHRPGLHRPAKDAAARSDAQFPRHQRSSGRLSLERLLGLPCASMPTTVRRFIPGRMPSSATADCRFSTDPMIPKGRTGPSHRAPVRARQCNPDQPVHGVPHSSRHQRAEQLPRITMVG